uniref:Uncharacterized protein n=1 Tax=Rhizophora mucronata TaxID=61149 RepID=A0A2P2PSQ9_RHIMU
MNYTSYRCKDKEASKLNNNE